MSINFVINDFDISVNSSLAEITGKNYMLPSFQESALKDASLNKLKGAFKFKSDSSELSDLIDTDLEYFTLESEDIDGIPFPQAIKDVFENVFTHYLLADNSNITIDFVKYLANELFGSSKALDLFNNEDELKNDFENKSTDIVNAISNNFAGAGTKANTKNANNTPNNLSKKLLDQVIEHQPERLQNLKSEEEIDNLGNPTGKYIFDVPLEKNDTIEYLLTIKAAENQEEIVGRDTQIVDRVYKIVTRLI